MAAGKRHRRMFSIKEELLKKSREAALSSVQIFNNPNITFKSETFILLMVVAWTYLLHAYYRGMNIEYRYFTQKNLRKKFDTTKFGAIKYWELERCLNHDQCPLTNDVSKNLKFLIGLRHEVEHQMTTRIDDLLSARFQACCINYHESIEKLFGKEYGIARYLAVSLQFSSLQHEQIDLLNQHPGLPRHIRSYIDEFDKTLSADEFNSQQFSYRVFFVPKTVNHLNQADQVIQFVKADSEIAKNVNASIALVKEMERPKYLPKAIVELMQAEGYPNFKVHHHTDLWKSLDAKNPPKGFGVSIAKTWYWYETWLTEVRKHCKSNKAEYQ
jgi:hypothetical protein